MKLFSVLVLAALSVSAFGDSLNTNQIKHYSFTLSAGNSYEISLSSNAGACANTEEGTCCVLLANQFAQRPAIDFFEAIAATNGNNPDNPPASIILERATDGVASVAVYAVNACTFDPPRITDLGPSNAMATTGAGTGQLGNRVSLNTLQVGTTDYLLQDLSRQTDADGDQPIGAKILAEAAFGYYHPIRRALSEQSADSNNIWDSEIQEELTDANHHSGIVYDYWREVLGINSFDDQGATMLALVNVSYPARPTQFCDEIIPRGSLFNAFWNGETIVFTPRNQADRNGKIWPISLVAALDVAAHEWGHAVSDRAVDLRYQRESGALNEAFSDWMGIAVEFYSGEDNWTMGEGVVTIRDIKDPLNYGQPEIYQGDRWTDTSVAACPNPDICENDYCGVHRNSGVANKMFYLLANGGTFNGETVDGIGLDLAMQISYDAIRYYWTSDETFLGARLGMEDAALGYSAGAAEQVAKAWRAVGVLTNSELNGSESNENSVTTDSGESSSSGGCSLSEPGSNNGLGWLALAALAWWLRRRLNSTPLC
ncbi:M4 family metallopeptidase [Umboniibacter marinipuniceus]|uniref:Thermolysin metallopeptidase-like protein n=1 Tax=Umboniibacter marinipuniceus TaxID=569599 RepID=A0A3M0AU04_9GAMM|nr:M4 family metallopeptidase [Umboniibacter marinipuniceus]RMA82422.1 thermolysin metallopeptidase-like protein [Umboniibacter marinipuniceus]